MTFKEFGEEAEIHFSLHVRVNGRTILIQNGSTADRIEEALGRIERHNFIQNELQKQFEELPESVEV